MKLFKLMACVVFGIAITGCVLALALPTLVSTPFATNQLLKKVNRTISGSLSVKNLSLGWLSGQKIEGLILKDAQGQKVVSIEELQTDSSLLKLLLNHQLSGKTFVKGMDTILSRGENGVTNMQAALSSKNDPVQQQGKMTTIQLANVNGVYDPDKEIVQASGASKYGEKTGSFEVDGSLQNQIHLVVKAKNFPVELLDHLVALKDASLEGFVLQTLGETADLNIDHVQNKEASEVKIDIHSPLVQGDLEGELSKTKISMKTLSPLSFTLTPKLYDKLMQKYASGKPMPMLKETAKGNLLISNCDIPLNADQSLNLMAADVQASIKLNNAKLEKGPLKEALEFGQINGHVNILKDQDQATLKLDGKGIQKEAPLELDVQLMLNKSLLINPGEEEKKDFQVSVKAKQFPLLYASSMIEMDPQKYRKIQAAFGPNIDIDAQGNVKNKNGDFKGTLQGSQGHATMNGKIQDGIAYLTEPIKAQFNVTPEFAKEVIAPLVPLLGSAIYSDEPIRLTISEQNFSFPLFPYNPLNATIGKMTLDLGKMYFKKEGELSTILNLLNIRPSDLVSIWFTPLYASFNKQAVNVQRFDMLVSSNYPMASWGKIDFGQDKLRMIIGVTGKALTNAFGIPSLDANTMMQIPVKGTPKYPKLDLTRVAAKISALVAMATGPEGLTIGTAINLISSLKDEETPPPTTNPLPWGDVTMETEKTANPTTPDIMKDIEKDVKKTLKKVPPF